MSDLAVLPTGRFKLKSYVFFGRVDDGTWFEAGAKSFVLKNPRFYPVAEKFVALLDAGHAVDVILARAPDAVRPLFATLLTSLLANDMLQPLDAGHAWPRPHAPRVADELLTMLEDRLGGAALTAAVTAWAGARLALIGGGHSFKAAAGALAAAGCREITLVIDDGAGLASDEIVDHVAAQADGRTALRLAVAPPPLADRDLVLHVSDIGDASFARTLALTLAPGASGVVAGVFGGHAVVAPATRGRPEVGDLLHWLPAADADAASHSPTSLAILGCVAAQAGLDAFFGFDAERRAGRVTVVAPDLAVADHPIVPAPTGAVPITPIVYAPRHQMPDERALETFEIVKLALDPWFDPLFGPFRVDDDAAIRQMPLLQYPIHVRRPGDAAGDAIVIGWGLDLGEAGLRAVDAAVAALAAPLVPDGAQFALGLDADQWQRRAGTAAVVASAAFTAGQRAAWLPLDAFDGPVRVLRRLLRYHSPAPLRARVYWADAGQALAVAVWLGDAAVATAAGDDLAATLAEALGRACSDFQLAAAVGPGFWRAQGPRLVDGPADGDWRDALAVRPPVALEFHAVTGLGLPPALACGFAVLRDGSVG